MKRVISLLAILMIVCSVSLGAVEKATVEIDELKMKIDISDEYVSITRDTKDLSVITQYGWTELIWNQYVVENDIYLDAIRLDATGEILVTMKANSSSNFKGMNDSVLESEFEDMKESYERYGIKTNSIELYQNDNNKYIVIDYSNANTGEIGIQYYTIINKQAINIRFISYTGEMTEEFIEEARNVVDSIIIDTSSNYSISTTRIIVGAITGAAIAVIIFTIVKIKKNKKHGSEN